MKIELTDKDLRHIERMANSVLMLNPQYLAGIQRHIDSIGKNKDD